MSGRYLYCQNTSCGAYLGSLGGNSCPRCGWSAGGEKEEDEQERDALAQRCRELEELLAEATAQREFLDRPQSAEYFRREKAEIERDTLRAAPPELYTCIGKGGTYELIGKSQGAGEMKHQQIVVYRSAETGLLFHRTLGDFEARMAPLAGGEK